MESVKTYPPSYEFTSLVNLKLKHFPEKRRTKYKQIRTLNELLNREAGIENKVQVNEIILFINNGVSRSERNFVKETRKCLRKTKSINKANELIQKAVQCEPNSSWVHLMNAALCHREPSKKHLVQKALGCSVTINPNCKTAWIALYELYKKEGGFYSPETFAETYYIVKSLLQLERAFAKWSVYANDVVKYALWTHHEIQYLQALNLIIPFLDDADIEKKKCAAKWFTTFTFARNIPDSLVDECLCAYKIYISALPEESSRITFFYSVTKVIFNNGKPRILCQLIEFIFENKLIYWDTINQVLIINKIAKALFLILGSNSYKAILALKHNNAEHFIRQRFTINTCDGNLVHHLAAGQFGKLINFLGRQGKPSFKKNIFIQIAEKLGYYERLYKLLVIDIRELQQINAPERKINWYITRLIVLCGKINDPGFQKLARAMAYKLMLISGSDSELLYTIGLVNISTMGEPGLPILKMLLEKGCIDAVVYLKALSEKTPYVKSNYLELLPQSLNQYILAIKKYRSENKPRKVQRYFLMASLNIDYISIPFEWLGIYYSCQQYNAQRAFNNLEASLEFNPYSAVTVCVMSVLIKKEINEMVYKSFLNQVRQTDLAYCWTKAKICFKVGYVYLYSPEVHYDYFSACENLRQCHFAKPQNRYFQEMIGDAYKQYGMHGSSMSFYKECLKNERTVHIYPLTMYSIQSGQATKYCKFIKYAHIAVYCSTNSVFALHTWASALLEKAYSAFFGNNVIYGVFLCQQGIFLLTRAICLFNCHTLWKTLGDLLYLCGHASESLLSIFVPTWLYKNNSNKQSSITNIGKYEALILALRCFHTGLELCSEKTHKSEFWYSIGIVFWYLKSCHVQDSNRLLSWCANSAEQAIASHNLSKKLYWEAFCMLGVAQFELGQKYKGIDSMKMAFDIGYSSFSKELECNLGCAYLGVGELEKSYDSFMFRRGFNPDDADIWLFYAIIQGCRQNIRMSLTHIYYHLRYIHSVPTISQWFGFMNMINYVGTAVHNIVGFGSLAYSKYRNRFISMHFQQSKVPHRIKEMTPIDYYLSGLCQLQYGDRKFALENFYYFIRQIAYSDDKNVQSYTPFYEQAISEIAKLSNNPLSLISELQTPEAYLTRYWFLLRNGNTRAAYVELLNGLKDNNCRHKTDILKTVSTFTQDGKVLLPKRHFACYKHLILKELKKSLTMLTPKEVDDLSLFWCEDHSGSSNVLYKQQHLNHIFGSLKYIIKKEGREKKALNKFYLKHLSADDEDKDWRHEEEYISTV